MSEILGALFAVLVGLMLTPKMIMMQAQSHFDTQATVVAEQQQQLNTAARQYIQQNWATIATVATVNTPDIISVNTLATAGYLPASFSATNPWGQTWQVEVLQPSANNFQALVMSTGGNSLLDKQAAQIAALVGASGGIIPKNDSNTFAAGSAYGTANGWTVSTANYSGVAGGHLASLLSFTSGQLQSPYLYRNSIPGQSQLNTMNANLNMGGNTLGNASTIQSASGTNGINALVPGMAPSYDVAGAHIGASSSVYSYGRLCSQNNALDCTGTGGTVINGGTISANTVNLTGGNSLTIGNSNTAFYGDGSNLALRAPGSVYFQNISTGSPIDLAEVGNINSSNSISASGNMTASGSVTGVAGVYSKNIIQTNSDNWGFLSYGASNPNNSQPQNPIGSAYLNDVYLRSTGKWLSQSLPKTFHFVHIPICACDAVMNLTAYLPAADQATADAVQVTIGGLLTWTSNVGPQGWIYIDGVPVFNIGFDTSTGNEQMQALTSLTVTAGAHTFSSYVTPNRGRWNSRTYVITGYWS